MSLSPSPVPFSSISDVRSVRDHSDLSSLSLPPPLLHCRSDREACVEIDVGAAADAMPGPLQDRAAAVPRHANPSRKKLVFSPARLGSLPPSISVHFASRAFADPAGSGSVGSTIRETLQTEVKLILLGR